MLWFCGLVKQYSVCLETLLCCGSVLYAVLNMDGAVSEEWPDQGKVVWHQSQLAPNRDDLVLFGAAALLLLPSHASLATAVVTKRVPLEIAEEVVLVLSCEMINKYRTTAQ